MGMRAAKTIVEKGKIMMNLKECYIKFGGDFDGVMGRLRREQLVEKFLFKFLDDKSFGMFETAMSNQNYDEALRAVHTLKGICQNLSFTELFESSSQITNALRENDYSKAADMASRLSDDYHQIIHAVEEYRSAKTE